MTNLQRIRKERGLSQRELAELSGVNLRMIQKYETGEKNINHAQFKTVMTLAEVLYINPLCLMEDDTYIWVDKGGRAVAYYKDKFNTAQNGTNKGL